jgi:adenosyl cobinamide kinase/adenosyl cobinamide phosphate guanylyltransferase
MGVHPSSELGRQYRDLLGAVNVRFAEMADRTALVMAGRALPLVDARSLLA